MSLAKGKETKHHEEGGRYLLAPWNDTVSRHQHSGDSALYYLFKPLALSPWEGVFLIF